MHHIHVAFENDALPRNGALRDFGYDDAFHLEYLSVAGTGEVPARVVEVQRGRCSLVREDEEGAASEVEAVLSGRMAYVLSNRGPGSGLSKKREKLFRQPAAMGQFHPHSESTNETARAVQEVTDFLDRPELPAVGDWVVLRLNADDPATIRSLLPRRSAFVRKAPGDTGSDRVEAQVIAANVDTVFIVMAAGRDWNPRRLERYMALAWESGARPVVVVTKADLADDGGAGSGDALVEEASAIAVGAPCALVCAPEGRGRELAGTGEVRMDDERGRHTTTHRQLYRLDSGALVIDSPGMRELQLWADEEAVDEAFPEIEALASSCRFRDCRHEREPGCAVRAALESGEIARERYRGWLKLRREVAFLKTREDPAARRAEVDRWKAINKSMRDYYKERRAMAGRSRG